MDDVSAKCYAAHLFDCYKLMQLVPKKIGPTIVGRNYAFLDAEYLNHVFFLTVYNTTDQQLSPSFLSAVLTSVTVMPTSTLALTTSHFTPSLCYYTSAIRCVSGGILFYNRSVILSFLSFFFCCKIFEVTRLIGNL